MKKQIFIFILALFVIGITKSYAQLAPRPVDVACLGADALHPVPGTAYTYTVTVPDPATAWTAKKYTWFVTQNPNFIEIVAGIPRLNYTVAPGGAEPATGGALMEAGTGYADVANTSANIDITWKSFAYDATKPVFVVINVDGDNGNCSAINNLKVYKIVPVFAFTLDIDNLDEDGNNSTPLVYGDNLDNCISEIQSATYDPTAPESVAYDFGADTLYYEVVAANWYDRWELSAQLGPLQTGQTAQIDWTYMPAGPRPIDPTPKPIALTWNAVAPAGSTGSNAYTSGVLVAPQNGTNAVSEAGESIIVRLIVDHGTTYEGITDEPITLAVDGKLYHKLLPSDTDFTVAGKGDINTVAGLLPAEVCPWEDGYVNDVSTQTIKARPDVQSATPSVPGPGMSPFLPIKP